MSFRIHSKPNPLSIKEVLFFDFQIGNAFSFHNVGNKFYTNTKLWPQWFWWQKFIHKKFIQFFIHNNWIFMLLPDLFKFLLLYKNHNHSLKDNDRSLWKSLQLNFTGWLLLTAARFTSLSWNFVGLRGGQYPKIMVEPKQLWSDIYYFAFWNRCAQNFCSDMLSGNFSMLYLSVKIE